MDEKNLAILMQLKEQLIVEEQKRARRIKALRERQKVLDARKANRNMVANHSNIARSFYSGNSIHAFSGGDVRPR